MTEHEEFHLPEPDPALDGTAPAVDRLARDVHMFGWILALIFHEMEERERLRRNHKGVPVPVLLANLEPATVRRLQEEVSALAAEMAPPAGADPAFEEGFACHQRFIRFILEEGSDGQALRHALDNEDVGTLLGNLKFPVNELTPPGFSAGFHAANEELARRARLLDAAKAAGF